MRECQFSNLISLLTEILSPIGDIREATALMGKSGCDVLISIGGGSPIDSAKAIAYNIHQETGKWIPSIAVPTTLSVAETTQNAGFTTEEKHKIAVSDPELVPKAVVYDGDIAVYTPLNLWTSTGVSTFSSLQLFALLKTSRSAHWIMRWN
jgi:3-oxoacid CoA-transferase